jgi:hypothetical protein
MSKNIVKSKKVTPTKRKTEIAKTDYQLIEDSGKNFEKMIMLALNKEFDLDRLEKVREIVHDEQARLSKRLFDKNFAILQNSFNEAAKKNKKVYKGDTLLFSYCPLENLKKVFDKIIHDHGFSYRWEEEKSPVEGCLRVILVISGYGHDRYIFSDEPWLEKGGTFMTRSHLHEGTKTHGKRSTYISGFGITVEGEDNEQIAEPKETLTEEQRELKNIQQALHNIYKRMGASKKFSSAEMSKYNHSAINNKENIDWLKKALADWEAELDSRLKK